MRELWLPHAMQCHAMPCHARCGVAPCRAAHPKRSPGIPSSAFLNTAPATYVSQAGSRPYGHTEHGAAARAGVSAPCAPCGLEDHLQVELINTLPRGRPEIYRSPIRITAAPSHSITSLRLGQALLFTLPKPASPLSHHASTRQLPICPDGPHQPPLLGHQQRLQRQCEPKRRLDQDLRPRRAQKNTEPDCSTQLP